MLCCVSAFALAVPKPEGVSVSELQPQMHLLAAARPIIGQSHPLVHSIKDIKADGQPHLRHLLQQQMHNVLQDDSECIAKGNEKLRVAVCFYGLIRNISYTLDSIKENLLGPLRKVAAVDVFVHSMESDAVNNLRSGQEDVPLDRDDYEKLLACSVGLSDQGEVDMAHHLSERAAEERGRGDKGRYYGYTDADVMNIMRSRFSIAQVRDLVEQHEQRAGFSYTHVVMARPDVRYESPLAWDAASTCSASSCSPGNTVWVPNTAHMGGLCDRLVVGEAAAMKTVIMRQWEQQVLAENASLLSVSDDGRLDNSEKGFCSQVKSHQKVHVACMAGPCIIRVRADGHVGDEKELLNAGLRTPASCLGDQFVPGLADTRIMPCPDGAAET